MPAASDYHSLLVLPSSPNDLLLGTHNGLFRSSDGGRTWTQAGLVGEDAMNLVQAGSDVYMGGHNVFAKSKDGGKTWSSSRPSGLPTLDVHGLAVDPRHPSTVYAQIAGTGLYRSMDGGKTFKVVSLDVNGGMMPLAVTPDGHFVIGDMSRGVWISSDGHKWLHTANGMVMGLAVNPRDSKEILATGRGIAISTDGGRNWQPALLSKTTFGPVAYAPQKAGLAYAVGYDRSFWRSVDGGKHWQQVT